MGAELLSKALADPVFALYAASAGWFVVELGLLVSFVISLRLRSGVYINAEDPPPGVKKGPLAKGRVEHFRNLIERANAAHRNAMENVYVFFTIGLLYALTGPSLYTARWVYGTYVAMRTLHPILYIRAIQPWRAVVFTVALCIQIYMAGTVLRHVYAHVF